MKLLLEELKTTLTQDFTLTNSRVYNIAGLKINILMYNAPSGTFTLSLKQDATTLASETFTHASMQSELSTSDNYIHGFKPLTLKAKLKKGNYSLELSSTGYTYSANSFMGWIKSHDNIFNEVTGSISDDSENPKDFLLYENLRQDLVK